MYKIKIHTNSAIPQWSSKETFNTIQEAKAKGLELQKSGEFPPNTVGWEVELVSIPAGRSFKDYMTGGLYADDYPENTYRSLI